MKYEFYKDEQSGELVFNYTNLSFTQSSFIQLSISAKIDELKESIKKIKTWIEYDKEALEESKVWGLMLRGNENLLSELEEMYSSFN
ncbi:MAG: hypothetical protein Q8936_06775 [Bacillota bacterium]|nr:hypothetical protein [Bacillota bacterium]